MSGIFLLDWATQAVSLFNASLMLWLGLTIAVNAERPRQHAAARRTVGAWGSALMAGSLLVGSLFFVSHSALLTFDLNTVSRGLNFWWHVGVWPVIALPLAWYVLVLWYSGYWDERGTALHRRHRLGLLLSAAGALGLAGLLIFANPLPTLGARPGAAPAIGGVPLLVVAYSMYILVCIGLALDALLRPGPTFRMLGDQARRRAQPWLATASAMLLVVCALVAGTMFWVVRRLGADPGQPLVIDAALAETIAWADLAISGLIALASIMLGQALVAYEVFTGKSLPRRGLLRFWRNALVLAAGYGFVAAAGLTLNLSPIYLVLVSTGLLSGFYALFSWRAYAERERYINQLRPFVASQGLYEHVLEQAQAPPSAADRDGAATAAAAVSFRALCRDVLDARQAILAALGPSAALAGEPLRYAAEGQPDLAVPTAVFEAIAAQARRGPNSQALVLPLDPAQAGGAQWAVPLRGDRPRPDRLSGLLLLGEKSGGGLYTQEEIDIGRAGCERLLDSLASAELARRLVVLQRQRLTESQLLDRRTRRVLHDDVLPQLHAALLQLHALDGPGSEAVGLLAGVHRQLAGLLRELPAGPEPAVAGLGLIDALRRLASGEFAHTFDGIDWAVEPRAEEEAARLPPLAAEVVYYAAREAMRNAARHGRGSGPSAPLTLSIGAAWEASGLRLAVEDNGVGVDGRESTTASEQAGAGQGLALHATLLAVVGGTLAVESEPGRFTRVLLCLPAEALQWG